MGNILIANSELIDAAEITSSVIPAPGSPLVNLFDMQVAMRTRFTSSLAAIDLVVDLGAAAAINLVALIATNRSSTFEWRVRGASTKANLTNGSHIYDSGTLTDPSADGDAGNMNVIHYLSTAQTCQWWRVDIDDELNADGWFDIGRLYIDAAWQPAVNVSYGAAIAYDDPSEHSETIGNQTIPTPYQSRRVQTFSLDYLSESEAFADAYELDRLRGRKKDVFVVRDPEATTHLARQSLYGLQKELGTLAKPNVPFYAKSFRITELVP